MRRILNEVKEHLPGHHHQSTTGEQTSTTGHHTSTTGHHLGHHGSTTHDTTPHVKAPIHGSTLPSTTAPLHEKAVPIATSVEVKKETFLEKPIERNVVPGPVIAPVSVAREVHEKPTIVRETILPEERIEIQPVVHRERDQLEVHEVVQPMKERDILPTKMVHATLPAETRAPLIENDVAFKTQYREASTKFVPTTQTAAVRSETIQKAPIIEEHVNRKIVEEIQPVLYKETIVPVVVHETQPIYEKVVEAPTIVTEMRTVKELGTKVIEPRNFGGSPTIDSSLPSSRLV